MILFSFADLENRKVLARNLKPDFHIHFVFTYKSRLRPKRIFSSSFICRFRKNQKNFGAKFEPGLSYILFLPIKVG